jgi:hypothetical protein
VQTDKALRNLLVTFLEGQAHLSLADAVKGFPVKDMNVRPRNVPYTFWHLLEHIRIAQWDIVDFVKNPDYKVLRWPQDYWPAPNAEATRKAWLDTIARIEADRRKMIAIVKDLNTDLHAKIPHGDGQTIVQEAILIVDHNSYHIGEFAILRQVQKNWK